MVALLAAAAVVYFLAERRHSSVSGRGNFTLCAQANQNNCVIDGDTIRYQGAKIRLQDIDAPEIGNPKCASEAALEKQATQRLLELMNAGPIDVVHTGGRDRDKYGRKLRIIERNGRSIADVLVAEDLARPWDGGKRSWCG